MATAKMNRTVFGSGLNSAWLPDGFFLAVSEGRQPTTKLPKAFATAPVIAVGDKRANLWLEVGGGVCFPSVGAKTAPRRRLRLTIAPRPSAPFSHLKIRVLGARKSRSICETRGLPLTKRRAFRGETIDTSERALQRLVRVDEFFGVRTNL